MTSDERDRETARGLIIDLRGYGSRLVARDLDAVAVAVGQARREERERCVKVCEDYLGHLEANGGDPLVRLAAATCRERIIGQPRVIAPDLDPKETAE